MFGSITDINSLWNGNKNIGWMYKGSDGKRYVVMNFSNAAGVQWAVDIKVIAVGGSTPGGYSAVTPWNGRLPPGTRVVKCFSRGQMLVP